MLSEIESNQSDYEQSLFQHLFLYYEFIQYRKRITHLALKIDMNEFISSILCKL